MSWVDDLMESCIRPHFSIQWPPSLMTVTALFLLGTSAFAENSVVPSFLGTESTNTFADVPKVSFSVPFDCSVTSREGACLADPFEVGLSVVLLKKDNSGVCTAKTVERFNYEGGSSYFEATRLEVQRDCSGPFSIAVIGVMSSAVRPSSERLADSTIRKHDELARDLLGVRQRSFPAESEMFQITRRSPNAIAAGNAVLLAYSMKTDAARGPHVLFIFDQPFASKGWCTSGHTLFYVNERTYLGYVETGCDGGRYAAFVLDLSSGRPEEVYTNAKFST